MTTRPTAMDTDKRTIDLVITTSELFLAREGEPLLRGSGFLRHRRLLTDGSEILLDAFGESQPACAFLRTPRGEARTLHLVAEGALLLTACPAGGWLLEATEDAASSYWIPRRPMVRALEAKGRILLEESANISSIEATPERFGVRLQIPKDQHMDWLIWKLPPGARMLEELKHPLALELQPSFTWSSQAACHSPAGLYDYLVHGHLYENARAWPRNWKICCELDASELYLRLHALETASGKTFYNLFKRQLVHSVISRQSQDGGWYHGEWTDLNECHYRFHCGGLQLLENASREWPDNATITESLRRGVAFVAQRTDQTDLGTWFLHDSLEERPELMDEIPKMFAKALPNQKGRGRWLPSTILGKSPTNKMILNTHVDTTVTLDRYREITGDDQYATLVASARQAALGLLALRPAEPLYRLVYRIVGLALLPVEKARRLPLPVRALKRIAWKYATPNLYRLKWRYPRIVMPGGFIDRHLGPLHFDAKYHAVNVMDLIRLWRREPDEALRNVIDQGIDFVMDNEGSILQWWSEDNPRKFAAIVFGEALYHACMSFPQARYRRLLGKVLLTIADIGRGLPPSLWGGNTEILPLERQIPCPVPEDGDLIVANLCNGDHRELLVVNPTPEERPLAWSRNPIMELIWHTDQDERAPTGSDEMPRVPARSWVLGRAHPGKVE